MPNCESDYIASPKTFISNERYIEVNFLYEKAKIYKASFASFP